MEKARGVRNSSGSFAVELEVVDEGDLLEVISPDVLRHVVAVDVINEVPDVSLICFLTSDEGTVEPEDET